MTFSYFWIFLFYHSKISWCVIDMYHLLSISLMNLELYGYEPQNGVCMPDQKSYGIWYVICFRKFRTLLFFFCVDFSSVIFDFFKTMTQGELPHMSQLPWMNLLMFIVIVICFVIDLVHSILWFYDSTLLINVRTQSRNKCWILCFVGDVILKPIFL